MISLADLASRVRRSVVGVVSPTGRGTGYCALPNGLIVTSLDVVGYEREVQIILDDGSAAAAVVARANVALDVALLMPTSPIALPPLESGPEASLGDSAAIVARVGAEPVVFQTSIASVHRVVEAFAHFWIDVPPDEWLRGAPVLDPNGTTLGLLTRPRRSRSYGDRNAYRWINGLVLPNAAFEGGLMSADGPPDEVLGYEPEYGCPRCDTVFEPDMDRCLECGTLLPHRWSREAPPRADDPPPVKGLFAVKAALASMGIPSNRARVGARTWRFSPAVEGEGDRTQVDLTTDVAGDHLVLRAPLVRLPMEGFEHLYRHLLTLNDEGSGLYRFSVFDDSVYLSLFTPVGAVDTRFPSIVSDFSAALSRERAALERAFGLSPAFEHQPD